MHVASRGNKTTELSLHKENDEYNSLTVRRDDPLLYKCRILNAAEPFEFTVDKAQYTLILDMLALVISGTVNDLSFTQGDFDYNLYIEEPGTALTFWVKLTADNKQCGILRVEPEDMAIFSKALRKLLGN